MKHEPFGEREKHLEAHSVKLGKTDLNNQLSELCPNVWKLQKGNYEVGSGGGEPEEVLWKVTLC